MTSPPDPSDLLEVAEVARITRWSDKTLYSRRHRGQPPHGFKLGRRLVYRRRVVEEWIAEQERLTGGGVGLDR